MSDDLPPDLKQTLSDHVDWINEATERTANEDWAAVAKAIDQLEDKQRRSVIYILLMAGPVTWRRRLAWRGRRIGRR